MPSANPAAPQIALEALADAAADFARASRSPATLRAYEADWRQFSTWCGTHELQSLPAEPATVVLYVTELAATCKPSTIGRRLAAISVVHQRHDLPSPTTHTAVRTVASGIRRTLGTAPKQAAPLLIGDVRRIAARLPDDLRGRRDRALLLVGFCGAMRRSELTALDLTDLRRRPEGIVARLRRTKTDQEGQGRDVALPFGASSDTCPVTAIDQWIELAGINAGPLFRSIDRHDRLGDRLTAQSVTTVLRTRATEAGLPEPGRLSGHSLRSGFATSAAASGATEASIAAQTGHRSMETLRRYVRHGTVFAGNAAGQLGL